MERADSFGTELRYEYPKRFRHRFSKDEDERLLNLVRNYETNDLINWSEVASNLENRNSRQCRERYYNYLLEKTKKGDWSKEEDDLILFLYDKFGPNWVKMSSYFNDRSNIDIKNHFSSIMRKMMSGDLKRYEVKTSKETKKTIHEQEFGNLIPTNFYFNDNFCIFPEHHFSYSPIPIYYSYILT